MLVTHRQLFEAAVILEHRDALAIQTRFQSIQTLKEGDLDVGAHAANVSIATKEPYASTGRDDLAADFITSVAFQSFQHVWKRCLRIFIQSRDSRFATQGTMTTDVIAVMDVAWQIVAQPVEQPRIISAVGTSQIIVGCRPPLGPGPRRT